ncbi:4509_t:CDS:2 [Ambispora leptoticha]|uniref:4509_t:CDS:1 n=1 Tax=Ambispora leptoticha TaxID=144679 RepID=A0A9N9BP02_9GLOM|nr:4509_t:CDS:2 [Ambispora leptoticha]
MHHDSKDHENALEYALSGCELATRKSQEMCLALDQSCLVFDNNELAEIVYRTIIRSNLKAGWVWKRLGFHELANKNYTDVIPAFQASLRTNSKDIQCLEGFFIEAIEHYKITIEKAKEKGEPDHFPSLKSSGDNYLTLAKEYFQMGSYGRAADSIADGFTLRSVIENLEPSDINKKLGFPNEIDGSAIRSITEENDSIIDVYSAILTCS